MTTKKSQRHKEARRAYLVARQTEAAKRLNLLADLIYSGDARGEPLRRAATLMTSDSHVYTRAETVFALNMVIDLMLNARRNGTAIHRMM